ncbi:MAG: hypothetical protein IJA65_01785 [Acholeplasmatales bacterium]|nr:hypothetical protein [Acholeplasmatales bacterium]
MEKAMLIFGGTQFYNEVYSNGVYTVSKKKAARKIMQKYEVDNFSNSKLTTRSVLKFIDVFANHRSYSYCILALGEADLAAGITPYEFEKNMKEILNNLKSYNITPIIVGLPVKALKRFNAKEYQSVIEEVQESLTISDEPIYIVDSLVSDSEMKKTLTKLCS